MQILVVNSGSSSIKLDVLDTTTRKPLYSLLVEKLPEAPSITMNNSRVDYTGELRFDAILEFALATISSAVNVTPAAIGHRVVHGGSRFFQPVIADDKLLQTLESLIPLAPLHLPSNIAGIRIAKKIFGDIPNIAVFDTAFHQALPGRAKHYAIPRELADKYSIRRYGFHGTSHKYVAEQAAQYLKTDWKKLRIISCHLGNGASVCAIEFGRSVEISMGMTALEGLVMGTRSGDIDPGLVAYIARMENISSDEVENILYKKSGLLGLSGVNNDMREILLQAEKGNEDCRLAVHVFCHRLKKYIGAYAAVMGDLDVLIFTAGIGENSEEIRNRVCQNLDILGIIIDEEKNKSVELPEDKPVYNISADHSGVRILVVKTDEELAIALDAEKLLKETNPVNTTLRIPIAISARHVHLCRETLEKLYGSGYELTVQKQLSQPGQFAANETLDIVGPKNKIEKVRILGPLRARDQVEISRTDEFFLGIDAPVRESGNTAKTPGITLVGPNGTVNIAEGVICAWRHIHMHPDDALAFGVKDKDIVSVDIQDTERAVTFHHVLIRVSDKFKLEMHIDTDEGNAAEVQTGESGDLVLTGAEACLLVKKTP